MNCAVLFYLLVNWRGEGKRVNGIFLFWYPKTNVWVRFGIGRVLWYDKLWCESNYRCDECICDFVI